MYVPIYLSIYIHIFLFSLSTIYIIHSLPLLVVDMACMVCESSSPESSLLFCSSCGNHYHGNCLKPCITMSASVRAGWQCPDCKMCQVRLVPVSARFTRYNIFLSIIYKVIFVIVIITLFRLTCLFFIYVFIHSFLTTKEVILWVGSRRAFDPSEKKKERKLLP